MLVFKYRIIGFCLSFVLMVVLALSGSGIAFADSTTGTATVNAGTLTETNATTPAVSVTLDGTDQTASIRINLRMMESSKGKASVT